MDVFRFLELYATPESLNIAFADPPYLKETRPLAGGPPNHARPFSRSQTFEMLLVPRVFSSWNASAGNLSPPLNLWSILSDRSYGESRILILRRVI